MSWERDFDDGRTAIISMEPTHNPKAVHELADDLDEIIENAGFRTVIFTSTDEKKWHMGVNLEWVMELYKRNDRETMIREAEFLSKRIFRTILAMPVVAIAAITGHAYANGMVFACMCDIRYMRKDRGYFCLPEISLGLEHAFLPSMITRLKTAFNPYITDVMIPQGNKVTALELECHNIIDGACENSAEVMRRSLARARLFSEDENLFTRYIDEKFEMNRSVINAIDTLDPEKYPQSIELFWKLMERMSVKA